MRCTATTSTGERCREERIGWLYMVERERRLRCLCTTHLSHEDLRAPRVSAAAVRDYVVYGASR